LSSSAPCRGRDRSAIITWRNTRTTRTSDITQAGKQANKCGGHHERGTECRATNLAISEGKRKARAQFSLLY
jgi:hypothetical protein